jgi:hypothetical protein
MDVAVALSSGSLPRPAANDGGGLLRRLSDLDERPEQLVSMLRSLPADMLFRLQAEIMAHYIDSAGRILKAGLEPGLHLLHKTALLPPDMHDYAEDMQERMRATLRGDADHRELMRDFLARWDEKSMEERRSFTQRHIEWIFRHHGRPAPLVVFANDTGSRYDFTWYDDPETRRLRNGETVTICEDVLRDAYSLILAIDHEAVRHAGQMSFLEKRPATSVGAKVLRANKMHYVRSGQSHRVYALQPMELDATLGLAFLNDLLLEAITPVQLDRLLEGYARHNDRPDIIHKPCAGLYSMSRANLALAESHLEARRSGEPVGAFTRRYARLYAAEI